MVNGGKMSKSLWQHPMTGSDLRERALIRWRSAISALIRSSQQDELTWEAMDGRR